jgi:hypothetical protein
VCLPARPADVGSQGFDLLRRIVFFHALQVLRPARGVLHAIKDVSVMIMPVSESKIRDALKDEARRQVSDRLRRLLAINAAMLHTGGVLLLHRLREVPAHLSWMAGVAGIVLLFWVVSVLTTGRLSGFFGRGMVRFWVDWLPVLLIWPIGLSLWACLTLGLGSMESNQHLAHGIALPVMMTAAGMLPLLLGLLPAWPGPSKPWFRLLDLVYVLTTLVAALMLFLAVNRALLASSASVHGHVAKIESATRISGEWDDDDGDDECVNIDPASSPSGTGKISRGHGRGFLSGCTSAQTAAAATHSRGSTPGFARRDATARVFGRQEERVITSVRVIDASFSMSALWLFLLGGAALIAGRWFAWRDRPEKTVPRGGISEGEPRQESFLERAASMVRSTANAPPAPPASAQPTPVEIAAASVASAAQCAPDAPPISAAPGGHPAQFRYGGGENPYAPKQPR